MAAARAANAPHLALAPDVPAHDIPPAVGSDPRRPVAAQRQAERAPRHPVARWFGIGSCVLLLVTVPLPPIGAEIEWLTGSWLGWQHDRDVSAPKIDRALPTPPELAADRDDPQSGSMAMVTRAGFGAAVEAGPAAPAGEVTVPPTDDLPARSVPVPALKPPLSKQ